MRTIYANDVGILALGYQSENDRTEVVFDASDLAEEFPGGLITVAVRRPTEADAHLITSVTQDGAVATWLVDDYELELRGIGEVQLIYTVPGVVAKTKIWSSSVDRSLTVTNSIPPDWRDIANQLLEAAGEVYQVTEQMQTWRDETEGFRDQAEMYSSQAAEDRSQVGIWRDETEALRNQVAADRSQVEIMRNETEQLKNGTQDLADQVAADRAQVGIWRDEAEVFADDAERSADRAEQIAATAGYMEVEIVDGHLIYRRTKNVDIDFVLRDGHLYMEVV